MREAPSGGRAEDLNAHEGTKGDAGEKTKCREPASESGRYTRALEELELGVGVRADFAVEVDLFVLRGNPFHERAP